MQAGFTTRTSSTPPDDFIGAVARSRPRRFLVEEHEEEDTAPAEQTGSQMAAWIWYVVDTYQHMRRSYERMPNVSATWVDEETTLITETYLKWQEGLEGMLSFYAHGSSVLEHLIAGSRAQTRSFIFSGIADVQFLAPFDARTNLLTLIHADAKDSIQQADPDLLTEAEAAVRRQSRVRKKDMDKWARDLAKDLSIFSD